MATSYGALCSSFAVNQKLVLKMDLPTQRESVLGLFDRVRKSRPAMTSFRRYEGELALETPEREEREQWVSLRRRSVRSGIVSPASLADAYALHRVVLETAPYYLSIDALDVDYLELALAFDLDASGNHAQIVHEALVAGSPLARLLESAADGEGALTPIDVQPILGFALGRRAPEDLGFPTRRKGYSASDDDEDAEFTAADFDEDDAAGPAGPDIEAWVEVKTRPATRGGRAPRAGEEPISVFLTLRRYGPLDTIDDLPRWMQGLADHAERLADERVLPHIVHPLREAIASSNA